MSNNITTYTRTSEVRPGHRIVSTYCSTTNEVISDETYYNNILTERDDYVNKNGTIYRIEKKFYDNGNLSEFSEFLNGVRVGLHKKFYREGTLQFIKSYNIQGQLHGISTVYHPDETVITSTNYINGIVQ